MHKHVEPRSPVRARFMCTYICECDQVPTEQNLKFFSEKISFLAAEMLAKNDIFSLS